MGWKVNTKNKHEMTTDLMFEEIIKLRYQCANLSTHLHEVITSIEDAEHAESLKITSHIEEKIREAKKHKKYERNLF